MDDKGEIIIYQGLDGTASIEVKMQGETVWLTQQQMAELFQTSRSNVVEHIQHIYAEASWTRHQPVGISDRFGWRVPMR